MPTKPFCLIEKTFKTSIFCDLIAKYFTYLYFNKNLIKYL